MPRSASRWRSAVRAAGAWAAIYGTYAGSAGGRRLRPVAGRAVRPSKTSTRSRAAPRTVTRSPCGRRPVDAQVHRAARRPYVASTACSRPWYSTTSTSTSMAFGPSPTGSPRAGWRRRRGLAWVLAPGAGQAQARTGHDGVVAVDRARPAARSIVAVAHEAGHVAVGRLGVDLLWRADLLDPCPRAARRAGRPATAPPPGRA